MKKLFLFFFLLMFLLSIGKTYAQRDPYKWPFDKHSIWNLPLHKEAQYTHAKIDAPVEAGLLIDEDYIILTPHAPLTPIYTNYNGWSAFQSRCERQGPLLLSAPIPEDFVLNEKNWLSSTPNAGVAILMPDGVSIHQSQPFARCEEGGYGTTQFIWPDESIYGYGIEGSHGGSGLSAIGGTIRLGEWVPGGVIRHAIKINLDASRYLHYDEETKGFRWPAPVADGYAPGYYGTKGNPEIECRMGALLALLSDLDLNSLDFETGADGPAMILARAFQNYGAYIVDDTYQNVVAIATEFSPEGRVIDEFENVWGYPLESAANTPMGRDIAKIITQLHVVTNNTEKTIGGGPTFDLVNRRAEPACAFGAPGSGLMCPQPQPHSPVTAVSLSPRNTTLHAGERLQLQYQISPIGASNHLVQWASNDKGIINVDDHGNITAISPGSAIIRVTTMSENRFDECSVTVLPALTQQEKRLASRKDRKQANQKPVRYKKSIGDYYAGGIIFHQWKDSLGAERGLVVSTVDLENDRVQFGPMTLTGATSLNNGSENTTLIVNALGQDFITPAHKSKSFSYNGYDDWYLPAIQELNLLYKQISSVNVALEKLDDKAATLLLDTYWSSTEANQHDMWMQSFDNGFFGFYRKDLTYKVRAIRSFKIE